MCNMCGNQKGSCGDDWTIDDNDGSDWNALKDDDEEWCCGGKCDTCDDKCDDPNCEQCLNSHLNKEIVCECGSEKVGSPMHSNWCPKYIK